MLAAKEGRTHAVCVVLERAEPLCIICLLNVRYFLLFKVPFFAVPVP
jgi:hypothetical protein